MTEAQATVALGAMIGLALHPRARLFGAFVGAAAGLVWLVA